MDFDDRVVNVNEDEPRSLACIGRGTQQWGLTAERGQEAGGDCVELADVPEGEGPKE